MRIFTVPRNRLAFFSREQVGVLKEVEETGKVSLKLTSEGDIEISGSGGDEWIVEQVLIALSYGFKPKFAFKLFGDEYFIEVIDLDLACHHSEKLVTRCKSRIIGSEGKAKKKIEELSGALLSVQENAVAVLGGFEELRMAKEAIFRLAEGAEHHSVYEFLETRNRKLKERELLR